MAISLPNALTILRIGLGVALLLFGPDLRSATLLVCIAGAAMTDGLDGYLARRLGVSSRFGAALDLAADGVFFLACVLTFWRTRAWPDVVVIAMLSSGLPALVSQALFASQGRPGSPQRWWNRALGGFSYVSVAAVAAGLWPLVWGSLHAAFAWIANVLDLVLALRRRATRPGA